ncbi:nose resistant to fluoxetine protein 6-like isoform X2 [Watersipora subatra]|uniref:nose resistant to fluoxetine protein 6-like isoform X2 n=1 Tax=Watersipora subatra TaxID=2589382 RepID=UPI00355BF45D
MKSLLRMIYAVSFVTINLGQVELDEHINDLVTPAYRLEHSLHQVQLLANLHTSPFTLEHEETHAALQDLDIKELLEIAASDPLVSESCKNSSAFLLYLSLAGNSIPIEAVVDSWGKPSSGLLTGRMKYRGNYDECLNISVSNQNYTHLMPDDFTTNYCTAYLPFSKQLTFQLGACVPKACSSWDVTRLLNTTIGHLVPHVSALCQDQNRTLNAGSTVALVVVILMIAICLFATIYEGGLQLIQTWCGSNDTLVTNGADGTEFLLPDASKQTENGVLTKAILTFSFYNNAASILNTDQPKSAITCLHGIRFFSMTWVILGHCIIFYSAQKLDNGTFALDLMKNFSTQAIFSATLSVDTFFVLSGLLVAYLFLRDFHRRQVQPIGFLQALPVIYLHRYVRLTPAYAFMILIITTLGWYVSNGPEWPNPVSPPYHTMDQSCVKNWYLNILYVNNLFDTQHQCAGWGWYLANDTQFFLVAPFIVYLLYLNKWIGLIMGIASILGSVVAALVVADEQRTYITVSTSAKYNFTSGGTFELSLYSSPWTRYQSYGVGIMAGYVIWELKDQASKWSKIVALAVNAVLWSMAIVLCMTVVYGTYDAEQGHHVIHLAEAVSYNGLSRVTWSIGLSCLIISCTLGYGGWVNDFLSWRGFVPLSRRRT